MPTPHGGNPRPESNFELYSWFFMRISGVLLVFLVLGHMAVMHIINSVDDIDYDFVAERWASPFWQTYDMLLLIFALVHGVNGVRYLIDDYVHPPGWRIFSLSVLYTLGLVFFLIGSIVLLTFQPVTTGGT